MSKIALPITITEEEVRTCLTDDPITAECTDDLFRRFLARADAIVRKLGAIELGIHDYTDIDWWAVYEGAHDDPELLTEQGQRDMFEALAEGDLSFRLVCFGLGIFKDGEFE